MIKKLLLLFLMAFYVSALAQSMEPVDPSASIPEGQVIKILITINEGEMAAAKIAEKYAKDKEVKEYAKLMVSEHKNNTKKTKDLAKSLNINLDDSEVSKVLKKGANESIKNLKKSDRTAFDKSYVAQQIDMHERLWRH